MVRVFQLVVFTLLMLPAAVLSTTWHVEQDGSGDYIMIHNAVNVASAGDTILIGPGEYRTYIVLQPPGWTMPVRLYACITTPELTFIGVGASEVIIGTEEYDPGYPADGPYGLLFMEGSIGWHVEGITLENCLKGIASHTEGEVSESVFRGGDNGISLYTSETVNIQNSEFWDHVWGGGVSFDPCVESVVQECKFNNARISVQNAENFQVDDCEFTTGAVGVQYFASSGRVSNCVFSDISNYSVVVKESSNVTVEGCTMSGGGCALSIENRSTGTILNNILEAEVYTVNIYGPIVYVEFSGNHILRSGGLFVRTIWFPGTEGDVILNFEDNYWGVGSSNPIAEGIWDMNDDPEIHAIVDFEPFSSEALPAEPTGWGDLKALYR